MSVLSRLGFAWALRSFGRDHVMNIPERALRTGEEAIEYMQASGVPEETALLCVKTVYSRPVGEPEQELGGILLTTAIACEARGGIEPDALLERELARVLDKPAKHFTQRNLEKAHLGLKVPVRRPIFEMGVDHAAPGGAAFYKIDGRDVSREEYLDRGGKMS
jgi:hypothetical protein